MTHNLADYHVPVNAGVRGIEVIFVEEADDEIKPLGVKEWAKSASSASRPRSPTQSTTRRAGACATRLSPSTSSWRSEAGAGRAIRRQLPPVGGA